jgi:hypothetical protein
VNVRDASNGADQPSPNPLTLLPPDDDSGRTSPTAASCQLSVDGAWGVDDAKGLGCTVPGLYRSVLLLDTRIHCPPDYEESRDPPRLVFLVAGVETIRLALTKDYAGGRSLGTAADAGTQKETNMRRARHDAAPLAHFKEATTVPTHLMSPT